jgi:predicted Ser/Thr protein kinase
LKTFEEVANLYNTYMDESEAYVDQVMAKEFVMTPPSFEQMKMIIEENAGMRENGMKPFRDRSHTHSSPLL